MRFGLLSEEDRGSAKRATRAVRHLARTTGGTAFFPKSVEEVNAITQQIAQDIRNQYILAYSPTQGGAPGFRKVKVVLFRQEGPGVCGCVTGPGITSSPLSARGPALRLVLSL